MADLIAAVFTILSMAFGYIFVMWRKSGEPVDIKKTLPTVILALIIAGIAYYLGWSFEMTLVSLQGSAVWGFILVVVDQLARLILGKAGRKAAPASGGG